MNLAMNFNAIDTKKKVSMGLLILYAALGILPFIQKEEPPRKSTWAVTSIQSTPTSNQAEQFRPSIFSQLNQLNNTASHLRNLTPAVQSHITGCFNQKLFHQTNSVLVANQSVLPISILERSQILRI